MQDVASKSLSGLESLVDQIPNMGADGEASHALAVHSHLNAHSAGGVVNSAAPFGHYTPTSAQANFPTYSSTPYAVPHYPPHSYSVAPVTSAPHGFSSSNPYGQGQSALSGASFSPDVDDFVLFSSGLHRQERRAARSSDSADRPIRTRPPAAECSRPAATLSRPIRPTDSTTT
jgi:hypothetical protein